VADEDLPGGAADVGSAYVTIIPSFRGFSRALKDGLKKELDQADLDKLVEDAMGKRPIKVPLKPEFDDKALGEQLNKRRRIKVDVDVDKNALGSFGGGLFRALPNLGGITSAIADLIGAFQKLGGTSAQATGQIAGGFSAAAGPVGAIVGAVVAAGAAFTLLSTGVALAVPVLGAVAAALTAAAGAAAAVPGALAGAGAAFATLVLGLRGITEAFKPKGGGGGGGGEDLASRARRIAGAQRAIEAAKRGIAAANRTLEASERGYQAALDAVTKANARYKLAQEAVNRARREAIEDISDLDRSLRSALLGEVEAAQAVEDALRDLNEAKLTGNLPEIARANNAYERAKLSLEEATDAADDLGKESAQAARDGVNGSEKVQDALRAQSDAWDSVKDAQNGVLAARDAMAAANDGLASSQDALKSATDGLAEAQRKQASSAAALAAETIPLAKNAQKFVDAVLSLKPAFERLRLDVQNRLFKDLDKTVLSMWRAWDDQLHRTLGSFADTFNGFFRDLGRSVSTPAFITGMATAAEAVRRGMERIGEAVTSKLVPALGTLAEKSAPFLEKFGDLIADAVADFGTWIEEANRTGALTSFFDKAVEALDDIWTTGRQVVRLIGNLFGIIFRGNGKDDKSVIDQVNEGLDRLNSWLEDPANQQAIEEFLNGWREKFDRFAATFDIVSDVLGGSEEGKAKTRSFGEQLGEAIIAGMISGMVEAMRTANVQVITYLVWDSPFSLVGAFRRALGIKSPSTVFMTIGAQIVQGLLNGITGMFSSLIRTALRIPVLIVNAVMAAGISMYNIGRDIVSGLWRGIRSLAGWLRSNILAFAKWAIPDALEKFFGIASPSKLMAALSEHLPEGMVVGIERGTPAVADAAMGMAAAAVPALAPGVISAAGLRASTTSVRPAGYLDWRPSATGDKLIDAIREFIALRFDGDPDAAFGS
jgi:hypothetical protein